MDLDDPAEVGRRIAAARGYAGGTIESFAPQLGVTPPTLRSYEQGKLGNWGGSTAKRLALLEEVQRVSGAPSEILGLTEPDQAAAVEILRRLVHVEGRLEALPQELSTDIAQDIDALDARLRELERGGGAEAGKE